MNEIRKQLEERMSECERIINEANLSYMHAPEGALRVLKRKGKTRINNASGNASGNAPGDTSCDTFGDTPGDTLGDADAKLSGDTAENAKNVQYYLRENPEDKSGKYVRRGQRKVVAAIAQKDYLKKLLRVLNREKAAIQKFLNHYNPDEAWEIYSRLSLERRNLVSPLILSDDEYAAEWMEKNQAKTELEQAYEKFTERIDAFGDEDSQIITERGEPVRSKSEKILADKLYLMGVPYLYEKLSNMKGHGHIKPDFRVLNKRTRKEYYWEHFGMMDNPDYCDKAIKKIHLYEKNHIFPGRQLILTYETGKTPLNTRIIEGIIKEYLL